MLVQDCAIDPGGVRGLGLGTPHFGTGQGHALASAFATPK